MRKQGGGHREPLKILSTGLLQAKKDNYYPPEKRAFLPAPSKPRRILQMKASLPSSLLLTPRLFLSSFVPGQTNGLSAAPKITKQPNTQQLCCAGAVPDPSPPRHSGSCHGGSAAAVEQELCTFVRALRQLQKAKIQFSSF